MIRKYFLQTAAVIGALFGLFTVFWSEKTLPQPPILYQPPTSPYDRFIAGTGIIEASSLNISVGSPFNEIITKVFVKQGDIVKKGDPLFELDTRNFLAAAEIARASLNAAQVTLQDKQAQFAFYERVKNTKAVSEQAFQQARYALLESEANIKIAQANLEQAEINILRSTIRSPIDGEILQVNINAGELAPIIPGAAQQENWRLASQGNLILMGSVNPLHLRIDIDEDNAWRYEKGSAATAFVRGNSAIHFPLKYVATEPYVIPKTSFTGANTERVDTRVLQVIYEFDKNDLPIFVGQILDVFLETKTGEGYIN